MRKLGVIYRKQGDWYVPGIVIPAFIHNGTYFLVGLRVYQDGMVDDWGLGAVMPLDKFKREARRGWIATRAPEGAQIVLSGGVPFSCTVTNVWSWIEIEDFLAEIDDELRALNDQPTTSDKCRAAYDAYQTNPSETTKEDLRAAYFAVPKHLRHYLMGDMDTKDSKIREVLDYWE